MTWSSSMALSYNTNNKMEVLINKKTHQWACNDDSDHPGTCTPGLAWSQFLEIIFPSNFLKGLINKLIIINENHLTDINPITVSHLRSIESHGFGPNIVSPDIENNLGCKYVDQNKRILQLSRDNLGTFEKPWSRVLSIILDRPILCSVKVGILKGNHNVKVL